MKYLSLPAIILAGSLLFMGCDNGKNKEKIEELEKKITQLEESQKSQPVNVQSAKKIDPANLGEFKFEEMEYDFGTIAQGEKIQHEFKFTNTGEAPLVISNIQASCGCTTPDWSKEPIKPGEEGYVKVSFNSASKSGAQSPMVTITANTSPSITKLRLKGNVNTQSNKIPEEGPVKK